MLTLTVSYGEVITLLYSYFKEHKTFNINDTAV